MKLLRNITILFTFLLTVNEVKACHAMPLVSETLQTTGVGVRVRAASNPGTCGCTEYWLDIEVRCTGEPFDGAPFNPGFHGPLNAYPYFQSAQMLKPDCEELPYPWVTIPYSALCPGVEYKVRMRENHNGEVGDWTAPINFFAPGTVTPLNVNITPNAPTVCLGSSTNLTAAVVGGCGLAPLYTWSNGSTNPSINVSPATTTTYTVTVREQCSNLTATRSVTVTVPPIPVRGTSSAASATVCIGETTNLSLAGHYGNIQWQRATSTAGPWTNILGATNTNITSPTINANTCFRAQVSGCGPTVFSNVTCVNIRPRPALTVNSQSVCNGQSATLTSNVDLPGGTYLWTPSFQTTASLVNVRPTTTTTYNLSYSLNGCEVSQTGTVTVKPQPTTLGLTDVAICEGGSTTITATPNFPGGNYTWTPNVSTTNSATVSPNLGVSTYNVDYVLNGCTYSESVNVNVKPVPTITVDDKEICNGETAILTANPSLLGGTFLWTPNGETLKTIHPSPNTTTNYGVTYFLNGCSATSNAEVVVHPAPVSSFTFAEVCEDELTDLNSTSTVTAPNVITDYKWDILNNGTIDYTTQSASHDFNGYGTYAVSLLVTTDNGCTHRTTQNVDVFPLPNVDFSSTSECLGNVTSFTDLTTVPAGGAVTNWNWTFDATNTGNTQNPQNTFNTHGVRNVSLEATTNNGCINAVTKPVEVHQLPVADFDFTNACFQQDIVFQNNSSPIATLFNWDFGDASTINTTKNPNYAYAAAGDYDVELTVETVNGCEDVITKTITTHPQPTTLNLTSATLCEGESTTITATPDYLGGNYTWTPNISTTNSATASPTTGVHTYTISYELNGCTYSESVDITVNPVPVITIDTEEICFGETATLTAIPDLTGGTYLWTPNGETTQSISHSPNATANYGVTYTLVGCVGTADADIIVNPLPVASFTFSEVCEDMNTVLNSTSTVDAPGIIIGYGWDMEHNGSIRYTTQNVTHNYNGYGTYDVNLIVTTNHGCMDEIVQTLDVYPLPIVDFDSDPLCLGNPTTFTNLTTVPLGGTVTNWNWDFDDANTANTQNPQNTYANSGVYDVTLEATTNNNCVDRITKAVDIFQLPVANFNFTNACFYNDIVFQNTSSSNANSFEWSFGDGSAISTNESPNHRYANAGQYTVELTVTTVDGCEHSVTKTIAAYAQPDARFTVDPKCFGSNSIYNDGSSITNIDGDAINTWNWDFGDGNTSSNTSPTHNYNSQNIYPTTLTVTSNYGCVDTYTRNAVVWPLPQVSFTPTDVCLNFPTQFSDASTISNAFTTNEIVDWNWNFGNGNTSRLSSPTHTYLSDGDYTSQLEVISNHGCSNQETITVTVHPKPTASFVGTDLNGCAPVCFNLTSTSQVSAPGNIENYEWKFSDGSSYSTTSPNLNDCLENNTGSVNTYNVELIITTTHGCIDSHKKFNYIDVYHNPVAEFTYSPVEIDVLDPTIRITNNSIHADTYSWTIFQYASNNKYEPIFEFEAIPDTHDIRLITATKEGCIDTTFSSVIVHDKLVMHVPNTFTPDGNNYNETFQPQFISGFDPQNFNLKIFNRWGEILFESNNDKIGWNGTYGGDKVAEEGVYIWKVEFKENGKDKRQIINGHVQLLR